MKIISVENVDSDRSPVGHSEMRSVILNTADIANDFIQRSDEQKHFHFGYNLELMRQESYAVDRQIYGKSLSTFFSGALSEGDPAAGYIPLLIPCVGRTHLMFANRINLILGFISAPLGGSSSTSGAGCYHNVYLQQLCA